MRTGITRDKYPQFKQFGIYLMILLPVVLARPLHAGGKAEDYAFQPVTGNSHWTYTIDLEQLEEGKHNVVIRSVDEAGNTRLEGPYDFFVDPETDIPSVSVAHPRPGDRVGRMLPIIGTARDDDGIARVEVSIDGGSWRPASGNAAWSAVLDAGALGDGPHSMAVRSVDINGIESPTVEVPFVVDTSVPSGGVSDPVSGARISGKATFSGSFGDPNGVARLEISRDGGEVWETLKFKRNKETGGVDFKVDLDSRKMDEGPVVWWFRGIDTQGSVSEVPFLFFVDNLGPEVTLELPSAAEDGLSPVPGNVFLAGRASDLSGVASLQISVGKNDVIEVPVVPGNPWWTWPLILSGIKDKQVDIVIAATDGAGNRSELKVRLPLDQAADLPVISIDKADALPKTIFRTGETCLTGVFNDDDGGGAIVWKSGELEGRLENVERAWRLDLPDLPHGMAKVELTPEDRFGLRGITTALSFQVAPELPIIALDTLTDSAAGTPQDWAPGSVVSSGGGTIQGSVISQAGRGLSLTYIPAGGEEITLPLKADTAEKGRSTFSIPVRRGEAPGSRNFILRAADGFGGEAILGSGFYVQAAPDDSGNVTDPRAGDQAINLPMPYLREKDGAAILREGQALQGWTSGASTSGATLVPESPLLRLRTRDTSFFIENVAPGLSEPVKVVLSDGTASRSVLILTDHEGPRWEMDSPLPGAWSSGKMDVQGTMVDGGGIASASWGLEGRAFTPIKFEKRGEGRFVFEFQADFSALPDSPKILILRAEDISGNFSEYHLPFVLDTAAPALVMVLPPSDQPVGAKSTLVYRVSGGEIMEEVSVTVDGVSRTFADDASLFALNLNLSGRPGLPETLSVRAVDRAGNITEKVPEILYDPVSDKPVTYIQTPADDSVVRGPTDIAGLVSDVDAVAAVYWRIDGGEWRKLAGDASFREKLPLENLEDGSHFLEVYAEDAAGNIGEPDGAWFDVTRQEAEVELLSPEVGITSRGITEIKGTARDANGIAQVWVSFDNGHTYSLADGGTDFEPKDEETDVPLLLSAPIIRDQTVNWRYQLNTGVLNDGVHTLLIKVIDGAGDEALLAGLLDVDNTRPFLALGDPEEGSTQTGSMVLEGRVFDAGGLESFSVVIERDGKTLLEHRELYDGVFLIPFDFAGLEAGEVLLRVEAVDTAGNATPVSRSFSIEPGRRTVRGNITLPVEGGQENPFFTLNGHVANVLGTDTAYLLIDGVESATLELDSRGRFFRDFAPGDLPEGNHEFRVDIVSATGERTDGVPRFFNYRGLGAWITIENTPPGLAVGSRPLLNGKSGYHIVAPPEEDKDAWKAYQNALKENRPERVEVSIDGGRLFSKADGRESWEFRIETDRLGEGDLPILVRSQFPGGWVYTRTLLRLDKTLPDLKLNESVADGSFNTELVISGTADDDRELEDVSVSVRPGSQNRYEVPSFIQGMYFDIAALGATWFNAGLGVTFFDDNVKLQVSVGYSPELVWVNGAYEQARVYGTTVGATLLANLLYLPLGYYWGHGWDNLSFSLAIGANFTYFTNFGDDGGGVMSSVVLQMEVPKVVFPDRTFLTYLAPYLEGRVWFFSSDVNTEPYFSASVGLRMGLF